MNMTSDKKPKREKKTGGIIHREPVVSEEVSITQVHARGKLIEVPIKTVYTKHFDGRQDCTVQISKLSTKAIKKG
jgi:hypothetical protein